MAELKYCRPNYAEDGQVHDMSAPHGPGFDRWLGRVLKFADPNTRNHVIGTCIFVILVDFALYLIVRLPAQ